MITLKQLRYLSALAEHRHFGRAAEACAVTQPALSMQIRDLEKLLGTNLVERRPNHVALTDVGLEVARRGEQVLAAARDLVDFAAHQGLEWLAAQGMSDRVLFATGLGVRDPGESVVRLAWSGLDDETVARIGSVNAGRLFGAGALDSIGGRP